MSFKSIDPQDLVISTDSITATIWSNNNPTLINYFTSSVQVATNTGQYYYSVYQKVTLEQLARVGVPACVSCACLNQ